MRVSSITTGMTMSSPVEDRMMGDEDQRRRRRGSIIVDGSDHRSGKVNRLVSGMTDESKCRTFKETTHCR